MRKYIPAIILMGAVNLLSIHGYGQNARPDPDPISFSSSAVNKPESKDITMLRNSYRQFMRAVATSKTCDFNQIRFNQIRFASHMLMETTEEESLQSLLEASRIIRKELLEKLPKEFLLEELKNYNAPVSSSRQGMILALRKDLDLYRAQMANSRQ